MFEYVVAVVLAFDTIVDQVVPLLVELSILYPIIFPLGTVHDRLIVLLFTGFTESNVGGLGHVCVFDSRECEEVPIELIAYTL